jgi:hypothetical protein
VQPQISSNKEESAALPWQIPAEWLRNRDAKRPVAKEPGKVAYQPFSFDKAVIAK